MSPQKAVWTLFLMTCLFPKANPLPQFDMPNHQLLCESLKKGDEAFKILAHDTNGGPLTYSMTGEGAAYFSVNSNNGIVTIANKLDREVKTTISPVLKIEDVANNVVMVTHPIIVEDANDNEPIFLSTPYTISVPENTIKNTNLLTVEASDMDSGLAGTVGYNIVNMLPNESNLFKIDGKGNIILIGSLSYADQSTFYQLNISAMDSGGGCEKPQMKQISTTFVFINVEDVADTEPLFLNVPYQAAVPENSPVGTTVFKVLAIDGDRGINDEIQYSIPDSKPSDLFQIESKTGVITVKKVFDRESISDPNSVIELHIVATEKNLNSVGQTSSANTVIAITVSDVNDNIPEFYDCGTCESLEGLKVMSFSADLPEDYTMGVAIEGLNIAVRDPDQGTNGTFFLNLTGDIASAFQVSPHEILNNGFVQILVNNREAIDYETIKTVEIQIVAIEKNNLTACCSNATITFNIQDVNDNSPEFDKDGFTFHVNEHPDVGTTVGTITASDRDSGSFAEITYKLLPESITEFKIDNKTGVITAEKQTELDREKRSMYYLTVQAMDGGGRVTTTEIQITLDDINDNPPQIPRESYTEFVTEGNKFEIQIVAFDDDEEGTDNSKIVFAITAGDPQHNFTIDADGILRSAVAIDREALSSSEGKIVLIVTASDLGTPPQSSTVNVSILVEDINDHGPVFGKQEYSACVMESTKGAFVTLVDAFDNDATEIYNRIIYRIETGIAGTFLIRTEAKDDTGTYEGNIMVDPEAILDYDKGPKFHTLVISASDLGNPPKLATATVLVTVLDMNDETPTFDAATMKDLDVPENGTAVGAVRDIIAKDLDTNHSLIYQLVSVTCWKDNKLDSQPNASCHDWFELHQNGSVFVPEASVIDYEEYDRVIVTVNATDLDTQQNEASVIGELTINIVDMNDHAPVFTAFERASVIVPELAPISAAVATVKATDGDVGKNQDISFFVTNILFVFTDGKPNRTLPDLFEASTASKTDNEYISSIKIKSSLDKTLKGQYRLTIEARDQGDPILTTTSYLDLITIDESFKVRLEFRVPPEEVQANQDQITKVLMEATLSNPHVVGVTSNTNTRDRAIARNEVKSTMEVYFVYNNGTAIRPDSVNTILDMNPDAVLKLIDLGLLNIKKPIEPPNSEGPLLVVIGGLVGALVLLLCIMITALVCSRKSYKRKIKSVTAMNTARSIPVQSGPAVPGTNKYMLDGANPVWNTTIDTSDHGFDEETSDRASVNSLDENVVDIMGQDGRRMAEIPEVTEKGFLVTGDEKPLSSPSDKSKIQFTFDNPTLQTSVL
uniref:Cadherin domain-containing protein n=1 Tax=Callorhinchus milii TaxID=7868 RepID=A0A4W3GEA9_CALMI|eukprot:gi/632975810/ref/XP_007904435.1/ PREDICTED: cadherin-related family member 2 [Callorhinchus milii]